VIGLDRMKGYPTKQESKERQEQHRSFADDRNPVDCDRENAAAGNQDPGPCGKRQSEAILGSALDQLADETKLYR